MSSIKPVIRIGTRAALDLARQAPTDDSPSYERRVEAGLAWLCRAQDHGDDRGFSYGYTVRGGWQPSYVETTGYIITTFLNAAERLVRPELTERAIEAGDWLLSVQLPDGSFPNPGLSPTDGVVFDTGQDLFGLLALAEQGHGDRFDEGARQAMNWLVKVADDENRWTRNTFNSIPHSYNSRVAWAQAKAALRYQDDTAAAVARANLDWACDQQLDNGWFDNCAFTVDAPPFTHTTAYAGRGLLEAGRVLGEQRYVDAAAEVARAAGRHLRADGRLPGRIGTDDRAASSSVCLTGSAQFAIIWFKLAAERGDAIVADWGRRAVDAVGRQQSLTGADETRGAIKGSSPVWGRYAPLGYPNWATKFFIDAVFCAIDAADPS